MRSLASGGRELFSGAAGLQAFRLCFLDFDEFLLIVFLQLRRHADVCLLAFRVFAVFQVVLHTSGTLANAAFIGEFVEHGVG